MTSPQPDAISAAECAALAGISIGAFRTRVHRGQGPANPFRGPCPPGRMMYSLADAADWLIPILASPKTLVDLVTSRCATTAEGCWIYTGFVNNCGYGMVHIPGTGGHMTQTHRVTYQHFIADIPDGLELDHLCRVRDCCNPWHLEPVTRAENTKRGLSGPAARIEAQPNCPCGRAYDRFYPQANGGTNRQCSHCRKAYKVAYKARKAVSA